MTDGAKEYEAALSMLKDTGQTVWVINSGYPPSNVCNRAAQYVCRVI